MNKLILDRIQVLKEHLENISDRTYEDMALIAQRDNRFFDKQQIKFAIEGWIPQLNPESINEWLKSYEMDQEKMLDIGLVCAGNIPLVGLHDLLCVLVSGNRAVVKLSSKDQFLMQHVINVLDLPERITVAHKLSDVDAYIATGSGNTARYFEYYFKDKPSVIRRNRSSLGVLAHSSTDQEILDLGMDVFSYYGMGCRNVTKLYVPENFDLNRLISQWSPLADKALYNSKYKNNFDYQLSVRMINNIPYLDCGGLLLEGSKALYSAVSVLHIDYYQDLKEVSDFVVEKSEDIQCIVANMELPEVKGPLIPLGNSQKPQLTDYADGVDTLNFLLTL